MLPSFPRILKGIHDPPHSHHQKEKVNDQLRDSDPLGEREFFWLTYFPFPRTAMYQ